ncbi:MAG: nucleotidyltransferase domain-containing protein [Candidatus Methylarchaceae archaeon HK01B]|nr:nucleotidyltransferase domain-containing protein [Candidatus Methylarchaceae archaeon HK01B]
MNEINESENIYKLEENERNLIFEALEDIAKDKEVVAICVYGSRITGYARKDSDYDVIVALSGYKQKLRYKYVKKGLNLSALIVDSKSLMKDAEKASFGEFVAGRLLNAYDALTGGKFIEEVERKLKSRAIFEILDEMALTYGDLSTEFVIPVKYLLFEKLKKRASLYPPALYSYVKTYGGRLSEENLNTTLKGFFAPLKEMEMHGLILLDDESFRIKEKYLKLRKTRKVLKKLSYTKRGIMSYLAHGYAGRVSLDVVGKEMLSKISRSKDLGHIPEEMEHPKNLWRIDEGLLIVESDDWLHQIICHLGLSQNTKITQRRREEFHETLKLYTLKDGDEEIIIAVKWFEDPMSLKWAFLNLWAFFTKRFELFSLTRLKNEYRAIRRLREIGLNTPKVISIILNKKILITEFIEGVNLDKIVKDILDKRCVNASPISMYGESIGFAHKNGYSLGDTKPNNAIFSEGKIFLTDLEQSTENGDTSWDIAEFIYYSNKFTLNTSGARKVTQAFLDGYLKVGDIDTIKEALSLKYLLPFQATLAPTVVKAIKDEMNKVITR